MIKPTSGARVCARVSEKHAFNPSTRRLRFTEKYGPDEERYASFTLDIDYYTLTLTDVPYTVSSPPYEESGYVQGPSSPSITVPTASTTALQTLAPFTIAVGLNLTAKKGHKLELKKRCARI